MVKASDLVRLFNLAHTQKWGYIYGTKGEVWTQYKQDHTINDMAKRYGQKWVGKRVSDCSGLFCWAFKELGAYIYHGSNTIWSKYTTDKKGDVTSGLILKPGTAVFKKKGTDRYHIGLYIGNGYVIEAKSTYYGVVKSKLSSWHEYAELKDVEYDNVAPERRTLRRGAKGDDVTELQKLLISHSFDLKVDGIFGADTFACVKDFQKAHSLVVDGVVGPATWRNLLSQKPEPELTLEQKVDILWKERMNGK